MDQDALRKIIESVLNEMDVPAAPAGSDAPAPAAGSGDVAVSAGAGDAAASAGSGDAAAASSAPVSDPAAAPGLSGTPPTVEDGWLNDLADIDLRQNYQVEHPAAREEYLELKQHSPARLGIGRAGARYRTQSYIRFRADHSAAQDAVFSDVPESFIEELGVFEVQTRCDSKDTYLTRPDLGRRLSEAAAETLREKCKKSPKVQIFIADGLSSSAVVANVRDVLPAVMQGLESSGISVGTPFFTKYGRVGVMDEVGEILDAEVVCLLVGERPGLITAESMSAYIAYRPTIGMPEARRTVVSNIHRGGSVPVEAGAHIADIIRLMLEKKASGTDLKL